MSTPQFIGVNRVTRMVTHSALTVVNTAHIEQVRAPFSGERISETGEHPGAVIILVREPDQTTGRPRNLWVSETVEQVWDLLDARPVI